VGHYVTVLVVKKAATAIVGFFKNLTINLLYKFFRFGTLSATGVA